MYIINNGGILVDDLKNTKDSILLDNLSYTDGVMIDVRITEDGVFILSKDELVYNKYIVSQTPYLILKKILLSKIHHLYIPTLKEVLSKYKKNILVIRLHSNYDNNEKIVFSLKNILDNLYKDKVIIITSDDNLYDYLKLYTSYQIYKEDDVHIKFINNKDIKKDINVNLQDDIYLIVETPSLITKYLNKKY